MRESDRLALELELERCHAFLQWVAWDEERQVDELKELVIRDDALLDEEQRLQEVFNTADRLSELVEELNSRVRRVMLHEQALKAALVKPASECETENGEWKTLSHYFPARCTACTRPCTITSGPTKDSKRHSSDSARSKEETEGNIDTGLEQELARLQVRAERADSVSSTLRCHLERSRIETKRAKKSAADQKLEMEQEMQKLQQQLRSSARQLKEAERRTRGAQEEAKKGKTHERMLQQQIDELHAEVETLGTHLRERDEQFVKLRQLQQLENQDKEKKLRQVMQSVLTAESDQKLQSVYQSHTNLTPAGCCRRCCAEKKSCERKKPICVLLRQWQFLKQRTMQSDCMKSANASFWSSSRCRRPGWRKRPSAPQSRANSSCR